MKANKWRQARDNNSKATTTSPPPPKNSGNIWLKIFGYFIFQQTNIILRKFCLLLYSFYVTVMNVHVFQVLSKEINALKQAPCFGSGLTVRHDKVESAVMVQHELVRANKQPNADTLWTGLDCERGEGGRPLTIN